MPTQNTRRNAMHIYNIVLSKSFTAMDEENRREQVVRGRSYHVEGGVTVILNCGTYL